MREYRKEIIIGLKKLKLTKREKKKNPPELQTPAIEAQAYNNNKKCD